MARLICRICALFAKIPRTLLLNLQQLSGSAIFARMEWLIPLYLAFIIGVGATPKPAMQIVMGSVWGALVLMTAWALLRGLFSQL